MVGESTFYCIHKNVENVIILRIRLVPEDTPGFRHCVCPAMPGR